MTNADRDRLRSLQDRWLEANARRIADVPDSTPVTAHGPTLSGIMDTLKRSLNELDRCPRAEEHAISSGSGKR